jgi:hypothetical protein
MTTRLNDTFTGTAGATLTGTVPAPVANGSDTWQPLEVAGYSTWVFNSGGGARAGAGTSPWFEGYALTGVATDQTVTVKFHFSGGAGGFNTYARRNSSTGHYVYVACNAPNQLILGDSTTSIIQQTAPSWVNDHSYELKLVLSGTSATVSIDGVPTLSGTVIAADGSQFLLGQTAGAAGDLVVEEVLVQTVDAIAFTGPASGVVGVPSTAFTLTPDGATGDVLTLSDGGGAGAGTFTPPTITLAGTTPRTFTYTPGSVGTRTLTYTGTTLPPSPWFPSYTATPGGATPLGSVVYNSFKFESSTGIIDIDNDSFKLLLVDSTYTPNIDTHQKRSDITGEVLGTGYTAGGAALTGVTVTNVLSADRTKFTSANVSWTNATVTARGAVIYKSRGGAASADELVCYLDFGANFSTTASTFTVTCPTGGWFYLA